MIEPRLSDLVVSRCSCLANSFAQWLGRPLLADLPSDPYPLANVLYEAPVVIVSHGTEPDPVFWFANRLAQQVWDMDWDTFTRLPSRLSAEPAQQGERNRLLTRAESLGFIENYQGIRVTRTGTRFRISDAVFWNVRDEAKQPVGQAAVFSSWELL
jgi:hypothetical protein